MTKFVSKYPNLRVAVGKRVFRFSNGMLVVNDDRVAEKLKEAKGYKVFFWELGERHRSEKAESKK